MELTGFARMRATDLAKDAELGGAQLSAAEQISREYESEKDAVAMASSELAAMTTARVDRDLYLRLVPGLLNALPDDVYLTSLEFRWVEPEDIEQSFHPVLEEEGDGLDLAPELEGVGG